ncbi:hypothetical protein HYV84_03750, partial [Candidatus Woesearchaeota archaeon]|nr:hypothetical protein [Candidatus Woesearchaeota archaeon]
LLDVRGPIANYWSSNYDVWIQGGTGGTGSGNARNLALMGSIGSGSDKLYVNYNSEYTGGTVIGGPVSVKGELDLNGNSLKNVKGLGGCKICIQCNYDGGYQEGAERCVNVNGGWSSFSGDTSNNDYPGSDNAACRVKMDCTG